MSAGALASRAEIVKLARLLGAEPERFSYLEDKQADDLRELRAQATDALFAEGGGRLAKLAGVSRPLPAAAAAKFGQALGPKLCSRVAAALDPGRAVEVAGHLPPEFLAEIAIHIDPRKTREVIARQPPGLVAKVTPILGERGEWVTMGRFLGALSDEAIAAAVEPMHGEALVRTGIVTEDTEHLDNVVAMLSDRQLAEIIDAAIEDDQWPEALSLLGHLGSDSLARFEPIVARLDDDQRAEMADAAKQQGVLEALNGLGAALRAD